MVITLFECFQDCNFLSATPSELFWQCLLRGPRLRTIIHDVFVSYLKNWQRSQIAPIIHISGSWNSCILKASQDCISSFANRNGSQHQALQLISHSGSRPALALGLTLLTLSLLTTSRQRCCLVRTDDQRSMKLPLWKKKASKISFRFCSFVQYFVWLISIWSGIWSCAVFWLDRYLIYMIC